MRLVIDESVKGAIAEALAEDRGIPWQAKLAGEPYPKGLVLFRLDGLRREDQAQRATTVLAEAGPAILGKITIIGRTSFRQRDFGDW